MRRLGLAPAVLALALTSCEWVEEQRRLGARQEAETDLVEAAGAGNLPAVRGSLEHDRTLANAVRMVSGRKRRYRAESALTYAIKQGRRDVAETLLEFGADPNMADGAEESPLATALGAEKDRLAMVTLLLEKGADPERPYRGGSTALHHAVSSAGGREVLPLLLAKAKGVGRHDARGFTPLHTAAASASVEAIRLLVAKGADVNGRTAPPQPAEAMPGDVAGTTPLAIVARDRQIAAAAALCSLGADPGAADSTGVPVRQVAARVAAAEEAKANSIRVDLVRHQNMAAFLARGATCDALLARSRAGERLQEAEVQRIANESECEAGWGWACGQAGWAYYRGEGAREDDAKALALFRKGCETALTPNEWCCGMAGILYVEGSSVLKDPAEGARWLARGCEPLDPKRADEQACNRLGLLYAEGRGVEKDLARAQVLFNRACDSKYEKACANLARYR